MMIEFFVPGLPVAQPRTKAAKRGKFVSVYTPSTADAWKASVVVQARQACTEFEPMSEAVKVQMGFYLPRPKAHYNSKGKMKPTAPYWHTKKPDADNLAKAALDAITNSGLWADDTIVADLRVLKSYAETISETGLQVHIAEIPL